MFIKEAKEKKPAGVHLNTEKLLAGNKRNESLENFLASKPMKEQSLEKSLFKCMLMII